jgi:hypothetical protein
VPLHLARKQTTTNFERQPARPSPNAAPVGFPGSVRPREALRNTPSATDDHERPRVRANSTEDSEVSARQETIDGKVIYREDELEKFTELETIARQAFLAGGLNTDNIHPPIRKVFPGMKATHPAYKKSMQKTKQNFSNWKSRTIHAAKMWVDELVDNDESEHDFANELSFQVFAAKVKEVFDIDSATRVFTFIKGKIDPAECSQAGQEFLQCKCTYLR